MQRISGSGILILLGLWNGAYLTLSESSQVALSYNILGLTIFKCLMKYEWQMPIFDQTHVFVDKGLLYLLDS